MYQRIINRSLATILLISTTQFGHAQDFLARDISSNPAYQDGWQNGDNGGFGFGPWDIETETGSDLGAGLISSEARIADDLPPQLEQFRPQFRYVQAEDDSIFYILSRTASPVIPVVNVLPVTLTRNIEPSQPLQEGATLSFVHLPQYSENSPSIRFIADNEMAEFFLPTFTSPRFVSFAFYPSEDRLVRTDLNLETNEAVLTEANFSSFPESFVITSTPPATQGTFQNWAFNDLRVEAGTFGSTYHGNDLLARLDVRGTERTYDATIDFRRENPASKGMILGRHQRISPMPLPEQDLALTSQQFELAVDDKLGFTSSTVYLEYDQNLLGRVRETDIQFVERITEFETIRIPCRVETNFNNIVFDTDEMGIFIPGGLKSPDIEARDSWLSF